MRHKDLSETFEKAIERDGGTVDRITSRACGSDNYDGVEYGFYGKAIHIVPIINVVAEVDGYAIESISYFDEHFSGEPHVSVFVAHIGVQSHPAFVP